METGSDWLHLKPPAPKGELTIFRKMFCLQKRDIFLPEKIRLITGDGFTS